MAPNQTPASSSQQSHLISFQFHSTTQEERRPRKPPTRRMGATLLHAVASLLTRLQRAARRMAAGAGGGGNKGSPRAQAVVAPWKKTSSLAPSSGTTKEAAEPGVWRKEILMGERCQPLDFSGAIYYDAEGRRLAQPPPPRSPMRSPLPASPRLAAAHARAY